MTTKRIPYSDHPPRSFDWVDSGERVARNGLLEVVYEAISPCCSEHGLMAQGFDYWYCEDCETQMKQDEFQATLLARYSNLRCIENVIIRQMLDAKSCDDTVNDARFSRLFSRVRKWEKALLHKPPDELRVYFHSDPGRSYFARGWAFNDCAYAVVNDCRLWELPASNDGRFIVR
jgi:hypothetical protein